MPMSSEAMSATEHSLGHAFEDEEQHSLQFTKSAISKFQGTAPASCTSRAFTFSQPRASSTAATTTSAMATAMMTFAAAAQRTISFQQPVPTVTT